MSAVEGKKIAIVGGGPGGLTLARLLQQSGGCCPSFSSAKIRPLAQLRRMRRLCLLGCST
jgi:2-polyprenyl-6-methoxyphenol hydroxylase-like FAD-dependent oxidoreductase